MLGESGLDLNKQFVQLLVLLHALGVMVAQFPVGVLVCVFLQHLLYLNESQSLPIELLLQRLDGSEAQTFYFLGQLFARAVFTDV
jgi:hypothetical protein